MRGLLTLVALAVSACAQTTVINGAGGGSVTVPGTSGAVLFNNAGALGGAPIHAAISAEIAGVELVTNGDFASGLTGWTVSGDGTGWSIVGGKLHHTPGADNKISASITVVEGAAYFQAVQVDSQTAGSAYANLGVDCNSDCSDLFKVGSNPYDLVANPDNGSTVIEIQPSADSDITITSISLRLAYPVVYLPSLGNSNIALGPMALSSNSTGYSNTAVGTFAMPSNTTGRFNAALGPSSLLNNTDGSSNTAMGFGALLYTTTSSGNVAMGRGAGLHLVSGTGNNTFIGFRADTSKADLTGSTCVGFNCQVNADNTVVIGNSDVIETKIFGRLSLDLHTPVSSSEACTAGQFSDDASFHYVCTATNTWKRVALSSF